MTAAVTSASVCLACGEPLGSNGVCLHCLLRMGLDDCEENTCFGDFEIERRDDGALWELGRGAMGVTYRAADNVLNRIVALKVIETANKDSVRERFLREARAAAALRHPNIAAVFQFGASSESDRCYCAMELVEGETLEALVRRSGHVKPELVLEIVIQVARALLAAADRGLVHRDLKPGNIMLAKNGEELQVKVIDFGLAKAANAAGEMEITHNGFVGTPAFASPEQFAHGAIDARTDIYALGVTMWFALTGRLPFAGTSIEETRRKQAQGVLPNEQLRSRNVPQLLIELLRSCLALDAARRPASARELMAALEACRSGLVRPKHLGKVTLIAVAMVGGSAVVAWLALSGKPAQPETPAPLLQSAATRPTENEDAYRLFLKGQEAELVAGEFAAAAELYGQAIALDPAFALAHARRSIALCEVYNMMVCEDHTAEDERKWVAEIKNAAEEALRLAPNLADAYIAQASYYLHCPQDCERALAELRRAAQLAPGSAEVPLISAFVYKRQNKFRERIAALREAEVLEPRNGRVRAFLAMTYRCVRDWPNAAQAQDRRAILSGHHTFVSKWSRAGDEFRLRANLQVLRDAIAEEARDGTVPPEQLEAERFETAMLARDYAMAAHYLAKLPAEAQSADTFFSVTPRPKIFREALLAVASRSPRREEVLQAAEEVIRAGGTNAETYDGAKSLDDLAIIHAFLGRKEEAVREAIAAANGKQIPPRSIEHNAGLAALALVYAQTGEAEKAIDLIEHLLTVPTEMLSGAVYNMTLADLKWRWEWDPLRDHPRFQKLLAGAEPVTIY